MFLNLCTLNTYSNTVWIIFDFCGTRFRLAKFEMEIVPLQFRKKRRRSFSCAEWNYDHHAIAWECVMGSGVNLENRRWLNCSPVVVHSRNNIRLTAYTPSRPAVLYQAPVYAYWTIAMTPRFAYQFLFLAFECMVCMCQGPLNLNTAQNYSYAKENLKTRLFKIFQSKWGDPAQGGSPMMSLNHTKWPIAFAWTWIHVLMSQWWRRGKSCQG